MTAADHNANSSFAAASAASVVAAPVHNADAGSTTSAPAARADAPADALPARLPDVVCALSPVGAIARLDKASRRGRLPGFTMGAKGDTCTVALFGNPFDKELVVRALRDGAERARLEFKSRLPMRLPALFAGALIVTVWPGEPLTDSLLKTYLSFYAGWVEQSAFRTWMWYYPLTVPWVPLIWRSAMKRTSETTRVSAHEAVKKIAAEVSGEMVPPRLKR